MIYRFIVDGGVWMLPILGASVIGLALILERAWFWFFQACVRDRRLRARLLSGDAPPPGATVRDPIARVLVEAVRRPDDLGIAAARAERTIRESKSYLGLLRFVGGAAALLGLIGTTFGIREAFHTTVDAAKLNVGIANALHATILGLIVFFAVHAAAAAFHAFSASLARSLDDHLDEVARILRHEPIVRLNPPTPAPAPALPALAPAMPIKAAPQAATPAPQGPHAAELADVLASVGD